MPMTRNEVIDRLKEILLAADERNRPLIENCTEQSNLITDFGFSSVNMLYMVIAVEEVFQIRFDNVSVTDFETLGDVVNFIEQKLQ